MPSRLSRHWLPASSVCWVSSSWAPQPSPHHSSRFSPETSKPSTATGNWCCSPSRCCSPSGYLSTPSCGWYWAPSSTGNRNRRPSTSRCWCCGCSRWPDSSLPPSSPSPNTLCSSYNNSFLNTRTPRQPDSNRLPGRSLFHSVEDNKAQRLTRACRPPTSAWPATSRQSCGPAASPPG